MSTCILWSGIEYRSMENCLVETGDNRISVNSVIIGVYQQATYRVDYLLKLNEHWEVYYCHINARVNNEIQTIELIKDNTWSLNGKHNHRFDHCTDVDIPLTPLTNTLPINRLSLPQNQPHKIEVIYIDILSGSITPVKQLYKKIATGKYHYENIPNDFEADIIVDEDGLVIDYPGLFKRI